MYNLACTVARTILHLTPFAVLCLILTSRAIFVAAADDATKGMPIFNGQRDAFVGWFMLFSGYVAWKATDTYQIVDGTETRPAAPAAAEEPVTPLGRPQPEALRSPPYRHADVAPHLSLQQPLW